MTSLREHFQELQSEGILVTCSCQEGYSWRILVWNGQEALSEAAPVPGSAPVYGATSREDIVGLLDVFERAGSLVNASSEQVRALDGEVWDIVTKRQGEAYRHVHLVHPELQQASSRSLKDLASRLLLHGLL